MRPARRTRKLKLVRAYRVGELRMLNLQSGAWAEHVVAHVGAWRESVEPTLRQGPKEYEEEECEKEESRKEKESGHEVWVEGGQAGRNVCSIVT